MKIYYAHSRPFYKTPIEYYDIQFLKKLGDVVNPSDEEFQNAYSKFRDGIANMVYCGSYPELTEKIRHPVTYSYFYSKVSECGLVVFRSYEKDVLTYGVYSEIDYANMLGIPILEIVSGTKENKYIRTLVEVRDFGRFKTLSKADTDKLCIEAGVPQQYMEEL